MVGGTQRAVGFITIFQKSITALEWNTMNLPFLAVTECSYHRTDMGNIARDGIMPWLIISNDEKSIAHG